tara:strand:- start:210 stop:422 length:213 start_codon:yes stop_codon:yes gene_type:complete
MSDLYGVLCESENGMDPFGNAMGRPILMESVGDMMTKSAAIIRAESLMASGRYGSVKVVRLDVCNYIIKG